MSNKDKVAIIIPIHRPDYSYLPNINEICLNTSIDLFVITSEDPADIKSQYPKIRFLSYSNITHNQNIVRTNIITQKKIRGVNFLFNNYNYDFIACIDCETILETNFNGQVLYDVSKEIYKNKNFYGGNTEIQIFLDINNACIKLIDSDNDYLKKKCDVYFWFSEIPIYEKTFFKQFYSHYLKIESKLEHEHFDFLLYSYWLVAYKNFQIINWNTDLNNKKLSLKYSGEMIRSNKFVKYLERNNIYLHWVSNVHGSHIKRNYYLFRYHINRKATIKSKITNLIARIIKRYSNS